MAAATETSCLGETSMKWTSSGATILSPPLRAEMRSRTETALRVQLGVGLGDDVLLLSSAVR